MGSDKQRDSNRRYCVCNRAKLITPKGKMQSPLEASVERLRNTRFFEEICAWNEEKLLLLQMRFMHSSAPKRRRSLSMCGAIRTFPAPTGSWLMPFIALPKVWKSGEPDCRTAAKSSRTALTANKGWQLPCALWG